MSASLKMVIRSFQFEGPLDLRRTLGPLSRGPRDPTIRFGSGRVWRATRTPDGPAAMVIVRTPDGVDVEAHGPGADVRPRRGPGAPRTP